MATTSATQARVSPAREDPVVRSASTLVGGPPGRHAVVPDRSTWWTPLRILMALAIVASTLGYAQKATCRDTRNWAHEYQYTRMCYSDVVALYSQEGLAAGKRPYLDYPTEYPPLIGAAMQLVSSVAAHASPSRPVHREENGQRVFVGYSLDARSATFYDLTALLFGIAACATVLCTALTAGRRRMWDAALVALAPALVLHLLTNWDIIAVAFAAGGMLAWSRRKPALAGVLFGLGAATKLYPLLFLVGLGVLCLRTGQGRAFLRTLTATLATVLAVVLPLWLVAGYFVGTDKAGDSIWTTFWAGGDWLGLLGGNAHGARNAVARFFNLNSERVADWDSLAFAASWVSGKYDTGWFAPLHLVVAAVAAAGIGLAAAGALRGRRAPAARLPLVTAVVGGWLAVTIATPILLTAIHEHGIPLHVLNTVTAVALALSLAGVAALAWLAPRRPRLPQVLFLVVIAFLLTNKVFSPQYTLWLIPLVALARPRWGMFLIWQATEAFVLFTRFMHFIYNDTNGGRGIDRGWFVSAVLLRDLALCVLAGLVVREILNPARDVVRATGLDDPAGGFFDGAPDVRGGFRRRRAAAAAAGPTGAEAPSGPLPAPGPGSIFQPRRRVDDPRGGDAVPPPGAPA